MSNNRAKGAVIGTAVGGMSLALAVFTVPAQADDAAARKIIKAMSDYLGTQKQLSFAYDASLDVITTEGQKITLASSGDVNVSRPDKIRATRVGGFANVELVSDGKVVTLFGRLANAYAQAEIPGSIDNLIDVMRDKFQRPLPGADLLEADVNSVLMADAKDVKDLGTGVIRGVECDHFAVRATEVDWQIWIATGDKPYPVRYALTTVGMKGSPQYTLDVRDWKTGDAVAKDEFTFKAPEGAKKLEAKDIAELGDLPGHFTLKGAN